MVVRSWLTSPPTRQNPGVPLPAAAVESPGHAELVRDLEAWRSKGVTQLRGLVLPALRRAAMSAGLADTARAADEPGALTDLVRRALAPISGSITGRCALVLLGLDPDTFDLAPHLLREEAADIYGVSWERFRRKPQKQVLSAVAERILEQCQSHQARLARLALERRHPADTRLATQWLERFETYFSIWTPAYGLGADLTAYRETLIDPRRPWDHLDESDGSVYTQEKQAHGYGAFALYRYASVLAAEQTFTARYGGLWLLSSAEAEAEARDALHAVVMGGPMNERDHSWLRLLHADTAGECHAFMSSLPSSQIGRATLGEWDDWLGSCHCTWDQSHHQGAVEYFPTGRYHPGIESDCSVHRVIEEANRYCATIEQEWLNIADWYGTANAPPALRIRQARSPTDA